MVIRCSGCNKIRKFGAWIEVHPLIAEQIKDVKFHYVFCPDCEAIPPTCAWHLYTGRLSKEDYEHHHTYLK